MVAGTNGDAIAPGSSSEACEPQQQSQSFAPANPTDGRQLCEWKTRYPPEAQKLYCFEAWYLWWHLVACVTIILALSLLSTYFAPGDPSSVMESTAGQQGRGRFGFDQLVHAALGGLLGGTIFSAKWLIHVVAKGLWNIDRRFWRLLTPYLSASLSLCFVAMMASGLVVVVNEDSMQSVWVCFGLGFLIGYFSDNATAKLSELAITMFGSNRSNKP